MRRLDRQLPSERALGALDDLTSSPVARGVHVVMEQARRTAEDVLPVLVEGIAVLGDPAYRLDPQEPGFAGRPWPEALEHLLGRSGGEALASQAGIVVELVPHDRLLGHQLRARLVDRRCLQQPLGRLTFLHVDLRQLLLRLVDRAGDPEVTPS